MTTNFRNDDDDAVANFNRPHRRQQQQQQQLQHYLTFLFVIFCIYLFFVCLDVIFFNLLTDLFTELTN